MKQLNLFLTLLLLASVSDAKTSLFGEANGFTQIANSENGTSLQIQGYLSEFGFRNETPLSGSTNALFDVTFGFELLNTSAVVTKSGQMGITGDFGEVSLFYGDSPLSDLNDYLRLMKNDPDQINEMYYQSGANNQNLSVGMGFVDGLSYKSPVFADYLNVHVALVPAEVAGGETGLSLASHFDNERTRVSGAIEVNTESANTQLLRLIGEQQLNNLTVGLGLQIVSNSAADTSARTYLSFLKLPMTIASEKTNLKAVLSYNRVTDAADNTLSQLYTSIVDEWEISDKLSAYGFAELEMANDFDDVTSYLGVGMKMTF
jgi:hypothetical protein